MAAQVLDWISGNYVSANYV